jgi:metal-responsive CopG/Arc/MetJ family transcriptional regulator
MIKTIQMTIDAGLLDNLDRAVQELGTNRSAFIREAVEMALKQLRIRRMEAQQLAGYAAQPSMAEESEEWDAVRMWEEA